MFDISITSLTDMVCLFRRLFKYSIRLWFFFKFKNVSQCKTPEEVQKIKTGFAIDASNQKRKRQTISVFSPSNSAQIPENVGEWTNNWCKHTDSFFKDFSTILNTKQSFIYLLTKPNYHHAKTNNNSSFGPNKWPITKLTIFFKDLKKHIVHIFTTQVEFAPYYFCAPYDENMTKAIEILNY